MAFILTPLVMQHACKPWVTFDGQTAFLFVSVDAAFSFMWGLCVLCVLHVRGTCVFLGVWHYIFVFLGVSITAWGCFIIRTSLSHDVTACTWYIHTFTWLFLFFGIQ